MPPSHALVAWLLRGGGGGSDDVIITDYARI